MARDPELPKTAPSADDGHAPTLPSAAGVRRGEGAPAASETWLGRYELQAELARGGMGRILVAFDRALQRRVVLKVLLDPSPEGRARFDREVHVTARLQHPSIVTVLEAGASPQGAPFYVMQQVPGRSLHEAIADAGTVAERLALLPSVVAVCEALAYAHDAGVVHRDLKPANVLVGRFGETVVIDWGLAKVRGEAELEVHAAPGDIAPGLTHAGQVMGTPGYMAPEQARGEEVDERGDVFSLGAMLWHLLAGAPPYSGASASEVLAEVVKGPPREPAWRGVPPPLVSIARRAVAHERGARYASVRELAEELRRFQAGAEVRAHPYSALDRLSAWSARHRQLLAAAGVGALALVLVGALAFARVVQAKRLAESERAATARAEASAQALRRKAELDRQESLIGQAQVLLQSDPTAAVQLLAQLSPELPGWPQARFIAEEALAGDVARWRVELPDVVAVVALSDGARVVLGTSAGELVLFDVRDGTSRTLGKHASAIVSIASSIDGRQLLTSSDDGAVKLWELAGGDARTLSTSGAPPAGGLFLADGTPAVVRRDLSVDLFGPGGAVETVRAPGIRFLTRAHALLLWLEGERFEIMRGRGPRAPLRMPQTLVYLSATPDGRTLVGRDSTRGVGVLEVARGRLQWLPGTLDTVDIHPAISDDGQVAALREARSYEVWDAAGRSLGRRQLDCDAKGLAAMDGAWLVSCDDGVELVDLATGGRRWVRMSAAGTAAVSPDGALALRTDPKGISVWDLRGHPPIRIFAPGAFDALAAPGGGGPVTAFVGGPRGTLNRVGLAPASLTPVVPSDGPIQLPRVSRDGRIVAWLITHPKMLWVDLAAGVRHEVEVHDAAGLSISSDGSLIAVADADGVVLAPTTPEAPSRRLPLEHGATNVWLAAGGEVVVLQSRSRRLLVLDRQGRVLHDLGLADEPSSLSLDGTVMLAAARSGELGVWSIADGTRLASLHTGAGLAAAALLPSNREVLTCDERAAIRLWPADGASPRTLASLARPATDLVVSADGRTVVTFDPRGGVSAIDVTSGAAWRLHEPEGAFDDVAVSRAPPGFWTSRGHWLRFWSDALPRDPAALREQFAQIPKRVVLAPRAPSDGAR